MASFRDKLEQAIAEKRRTENPVYGKHTIARKWADGDEEKFKSRRRLLYKYLGDQPSVPREQTRRELERVMGLEPDALKPDAEETTDQEEVAA